MNVTNRPFLVCLLAIGLMLAIGGFAAQAADAPLFTAMAAQEAEAVAADTVDPPYLLRQQHVTLNISLAGDSAYGTMSVPTLQLNLFPDVNLVAEQDRLEFPDAETVIWYGRISGAVVSEVTLVARGGVMTGNVRWDGRHCQIRYAGGGAHVIQEFDDTLFDGCQEVLPEDGWVDPTATTALPFDLQAEPDSGATFDILVLYTPATETAAGGQAAIEGIITLAISETNTGMGNSGVTPRVNLVHMQEISYVEGTGTQGFTDALTALQNPSDGLMDSAHTLRDSYGADNVVLLINSGGYCGLGYVMSSPSNLFESLAFSVVAWSCATGNYSFGHEMGHNWGCHHDRANASGTGSYSYSYGYQQLAVPQRTIMAYDNGCSCPRLNYWSNPDVLVNGFPMGVVNTAPTAADNRLTLNNNATIIANWRQTAGPPPPASGVTLTPNVASPQSSGTTVTWLAAGQGGSGGYEYQFSLQGPATGNVMTVQQAYSVSSAWVWPTAGSDIGANTVKVQVRNAGTVVAEDASTTAGFDIITGPITGVTLAPDLASPQEAGTSVTWTAAAIGGGVNVEYEFWLLAPSTGNAWTVIRPYGASPTWTWDTAGEVGTGNGVHVRVRNQGSSAAYEAYATVLSYAVTAPAGAATGVSLTPSVASPQTSGATVVWTAAGQGGSGNYEFQFALQGPATGNVMTVQQAYSATATWTWTTTATDEGANTVRVQVRNAGSSVSEDASTNVGYTIAAPAAGPPTSVTLVPDVASPQQAGTTVTWTAAAAGGSGPYEYEFWLLAPSTGNVWTTVRAYSATATWAWSTSGDVGTGAVHVRARNQGSAAAYEAYTTVLNYKITQPAGAATGVSLTPSVASPQTLGTTVTWTAAGQGGSGSYEYQFALQGPATGNVMVVQQAYSTTATWAWSTSVADQGANTVRVQVRNAGSVVTQDAAMTAAFVIDPPGASGPTSVVLVPSLASPQEAGTSITWSAAAAGGTGPYEYEFWLNAPSTGGAWTVVRAYGATAAWVWNTAGDVGTSAVHVRARNQGSAAAYEAFTTVLGYRITTPAGAATGVTLTPSVVSPQISGTTVTWTAAGLGGSGSYEYQFALQGPATGNVMTVQQAYSATPTWAWTTTAADEGASSVRVQVRNAGSSVTQDASAVAGYTIDPPGGAVPTSVTLTPDAASPQDAGTVVTWTAAAAGGGGPYEYEFWLNSPSTGGAWTVIRPYGAATWAWDTAAEVGTSAIHVRARNQGSAAAYETFTTVLSYIVTIPPGAATGVSLTPNVANPQTSGAAVVFTAAGQGGSGNYEYQFALQGPATGNIMTVQQAYSAIATWTWNTIGADEGANTVRVQVRNAGSSVTQDAATTVAYTIDPPGPAAPTSVTLIPNAVSPQQAGTLVTWTAAAAGGTGPYEYEFWLNAPSTGNTWVVIQAYGVDTWVWDTTGEVGTSAVHVRARNQGSAAAWETYTNVLNYNVTVGP